MSFVKLNTDVLKQVADHFGIDLEEIDKDSKGEPKRQALIKSFSENGVSWEMYKAAFPDPEDLPEVEKVEAVNEEPVVEKSPVRDQPQVLLRMHRTNGVYEVRGYKFTREHPFLPVSQDDAEFIVANHEGFRVALPSEAEEFYS
jgi:hypothetical protein